jgi:hypothetical protein
MELGIEPWTWVKKLSFGKIKSSVLARSMDQAGLWKEGLLGSPSAAPQTGATGGVNKYESFWLAFIFFSPDAA